MGVGVKEGGTVWVCVSVGIGERVGGAVGVGVWQAARQRRGRMNKITRFMGIFYRRMFKEMRETGIFSIEQHRYISRPKRASREIKKEACRCKPLF